MSVIIDLKGLKHVEDKSFYNHNYYKKEQSNIGTLIRIDHTDDNNEVDVYIVDGNTEIFLGSAIDEDTGIFNIELGHHYT